MKEVKKFVTSTGDYRVKVILGCSGTKLEDRTSGKTLYICVKADDATEATAEVKAFLAEKLHIWETGVHIEGASVSSKEKNVFIKL